MDDSRVAMSVKPCPFCGGVPVLHRLGGKGSTHGWVECKECHASLPFKPTFEAAIADWNRRTV